MLTCPPVSVQDCQAIPRHALTIFVRSAQHRVFDIPVLGQEMSEGAMRYHEYLPRQSPLKNTDTHACPTSVSGRWYSHFLSSAARREMAAFSYAQ